MGKKNGKNGKNGKKKDKENHSSSAPASTLTKHNGADLPRIDRKFYEKELKRLQFELVRLQYWVKENNQRVVLVFEGRDAAGKGGLVKRIVEPLNPRGVRLVALNKPSDVERTQWYFQRYTVHLPAAGEIVIFDRSWYNRAGVERVMGFCTEEEYWEFMHSCPEYERMLVRAGIHVIKYWISVSNDEQERRFQERATNPAKYWKLSPMDLVSRERWAEYSKAKDTMMEYTDIPGARWYQIDWDDKRRAQLNCLAHLLSLCPGYEEVKPQIIKLGKRPADDENYARPPRENHIVVPDRYANYAVLPEAGDDD